MKFKANLILIGVLLFAVSTLAIAGPNQAAGGVFDNVLAQFHTASSAWASIVQQAASRLFWSLAVISMVWTFGFMALRRADLGEFFAEFIRFTIFVGFFYWLLTNGPRFATDIINSLRDLGSQASGQANAITPSGVVDVGFGIFQKVVDNSSFWSPGVTTAGIIMGAIVLGILALVGVNMLLLLCAAWFLIYGGIFFLGFGGSRWTSDMAIAYYKAVLGVAIQLFAMVLLVGIGQSFLDSYYKSMSAGLNLKELGVMLVVALILLALVNKIPPMLASIVGGPQMNAGSHGVGALIGGAAMAGAAVAAGGAAIAAGATSAAGGAKALMAAVQAGSAAASDGAGGGGELASAMGGAANDSDGGSPLAAAMGDGGSGGGSGSGSSASSAGGGVSQAAASGTTASVGSASGGGSMGTMGNTVAGNSAGSTGAGVPPGDAGGVAASEGAAGDVAAAAGDADSAAAAATAGSVESAAPGGSAGSTGRSASQRAAAFATGAAGALASGMGRQMANRVAAMNERWQARVDNTMGGRLAQEIRNPGATAQDRRDNRAITQAQQIQGRQDLRAAGAAARDFLGGGAPAPAPVPAPASEAPTFTGDSISGNDQEAVDPAAEVAAFRDRGTT